MIHKSCFVWNSYERVSSTVFSRQKVWNSIHICQYFLSQISTYVQCPLSYTLDMYGYITLRHE